MRGGDFGVEEARRAGFREEGAASRRGRVRGRCRVAREIAKGVQRSRRREPRRRRTLNVRTLVKRRRQSLRELERPLLR